MRWHFGVLHVHSWGSSLFKVLLEVVQDEDFLSLPKERDGGEY